MEISQIADKSLFALKTTDSIELAISMMEPLKVWSLPVVEKEKLKGFVSLHDLRKAKNMAKKSITHWMKPNEGWVLSLNFHHIEALKSFAQFEADCLCIVNEDGVLQGIISPFSLINFLNQTYTISAEGSVIVIDMLARNYSLHEISRIVENEGTKILGVTLIPVQEGRIQVNLKLNTQYTDRVLLSLQRFGYEVTQIFFNPPENSDLEMRYNALLKYLEI